MAQTVGAHPGDGTARRVAAARAVWGSVLVVASRTAVWNRDEQAAVATALGVRHLIQAALTLAKPGSTHWMWTIDAAHGASMLGLAAVAPRWRTFALSSATGAATWAFAARQAR